MHHILYPAGSTNQPLFSQLLFACHCFSIISQEMQTDVQVQNYKRNTEKYKLSEKSLTSSQNPPTSLFYIGLYLLTAQRFRIQNRFSPSRKKMVGLIYQKNISFIRRCSSCFSLDPCMQLQCKGRHFTIPYF